MTAAPRFAVPCDELGARIVMVACRDCNWIEARSVVPQSCPRDWRHRGPGMVRTWLYCDHGCWEQNSTDYLMCTASTAGDPHEVFIDPERSVFL